MEAASPGDAAVPPRPFLRVPDFGSSSSMPPISRSAYVSKIPQQHLVGAAVSIEARCPLAKELTGDKVDPVKGPSRASLQNFRAFF
jgi:hypothetical protein